MVWPCLKIFWFSKDNPTGHGEGKKKKEADRRRGGKTILKSGQEWTLPAQLGQLKTGQDGNCCEFICGAPTTFQGYGIEQNRKYFVSAHALFSNSLLILRNEIEAIRSY